MQRYDVIVLGAGGVGSAALYELSRRGVRALGIDRFQPPHDRGSSHGETRVIRQAYFEHPDYVPLLKESYRLWRELEAATGRHLFHRTGLLEVGPADGTVVPGVLRAAAQHGLEIEQWTAAEIEGRWLGLRVPTDMVGVFERNAGYLLVEDCVVTHLAAAKECGAELLFNTEVADFDELGDEVRVWTADDEFAASKLIIATGAWASHELGMFAPKFTVKRKSLFWFESSADCYKVNTGFPVYLYELPAGVFYGFPSLDGHRMKVAEHSGGEIVEDPLQVSREVDPTEQQRVIDFLTSHVPKLSHRVVDHAVCLYTMSPDEHFIVDGFPSTRNIVFAAGLSGHGFKFVPILGRILAELALDGATQQPIDFLSLHRFS